MAQRGSSEDPKITSLREARCLNPRPEDVTDAVFGSSEFFDARDAVQVKYEMVRRVRVDGASVTSAASAFGYSRPSFYQAAAALDEQGLDGLVPGKPGPRGRHKLTDEVCEFAEQQLTVDPTLRARDLVGPIQQRFGVRVHPRSIERALTRYRELQSKSR
jgi:transposase